MENILTEIREQLKNDIDKRTQEGMQRFFKEPVKCYGVKAQHVGNIAKKFFKTLSYKTKEEIFNLCNNLWQSGYIEESFIACNWSYRLHKDFKPEDFVLFEKWVKTYVNNWASCDTLCNHTIGEFIEMYPVFLSRLKEFAKSDNRWVRRAAAVSLIIPARKGKFLSDIIEIADSLLLDKDDLVQKGYGWMLKAASQSHLNEIFDYVMSKKTVMPRTALRYAVEKMPDEMRKRAMEKQ
jgi:3-methyladenine DNA glycosylase AlkD